jgi:hypothetical protein
VITVLGGDWSVLAGLNVRETLTGAWTELEIGSTPRVSVSIAPHLTALAMLADAVAGRRRGLPEGLRRAIQGSVTAASWESVRPLAAPGYSVVPDSVVPLPPTADVSVASQVAWLRDVPAETLLGDLDQAYGEERVPEHWRRAAHRPRRWLDGYATALTDVWSVIEPRWRRARPLLDREIERIGAAVVRGALDAVLTTFGDRIRFAGGTLRLNDLESARFTLGDRRLVFVPMLAGADATIVSLDRPGHVWIAYPVPGAQSLWQRPPAPVSTADELAAVLGPVRADLLRSLDGPMTMGRLAARAVTVPSGITYHCERLIEAGLIMRERRGREVWVLRTRRGDELLDLFAR